GIRDRNVTGVQTCALPILTETALGVQFAPVEGWDIPHFGLFWHEIRRRYPRFEVQPLLVSEVERPALEFKHPQPPSVELVSRPPVRCWFLNESNTELIQVQQDRFVHNWRKMVGSGAYLHYEEH